MAVGTHDEEVDVVFLHRGRDDLIHASRRCLGADGIARGAEIAGRFLQVITVAYAALKDDGEFGYMLRMRPDGMWGIERQSKRGAVASDGLPRCYQK